MDGSSSRSSDHSDRGEPRVVLTLELGAEDELASDDEIGRELEIGGQDMDPLFRNAGEIDAIRGPHFEFATIEFDPGFSGLPELGTCPCQPSRGDGARIIPDGNDLGLRPLTRKIEQLTVPADLETAGIKRHSLEFHRKELPTKIDLSHPWCALDLGHDLAIEAELARPARKPSHRPCERR